MKVLVTGSSGLIGSGAVEYYDRMGCTVFGVDNNMRRVFFGPAGDTAWNLERFKSITRHFTHLDLDIRDREALFPLLAEQEFDLVVHFRELPTRWEHARPQDYDGIREDCRIGCCTHSIFGASKVAADVMAQEYGRYYGLK